MIAWIESREIATGENNGVVITNANPRATRTYHPAVPVPAARQGHLREVRNQNEVVALYELNTKHIYDPI